MQQHRPECGEFLTVRDLSLRGRGLLSVFWRGGLLGAGERVRGPPGLFLHLGEDQLLHQLIHLVLTQGLQVH